MVIGKYELYRNELGIVFKTMAKNGNCCQNNRFVK